MPPRYSSTIPKGRPTARPAWQAGLGIAGALLAALAISQLITGRIPFGTVGEVNDLRIAVVHCLLVAYAPAAFLHLRAITLRTLRELRPALRLDDAAFASELASAGGVRPVSFLIAGLIGLAIAALGPFLSGPGPSNPWNPDTWVPEVVWHRILGPLVGIWIAWLSWAIVRESQRFSRLAASLAPLELLDLRPLAPFTSQALTHVLLTLGLLAVFGLFVVDQGITPIFLIMTAFSLALALASLLLPMRGVRREIAAAKSAELSRLDRLIRADASALRDPPVTTTSGRLADLVAYRTLIDGISEWRFSQSVALRATLYLLIPLASWLASGLLGALVERSIFGN